jgi:hypothetical protein
MLCPEGIKSKIRPIIAINILQSSAIANQNSIYPDTTVSAPGEIAINKQPDPLQ